MGRRLLVGVTAVGILFWLPLLFGVPLQGYGSESSVPTYLSAFFLFAAAWEGGGLFRACRLAGGGRDATLLWLLAAAGFAFLGADELFCIHEGIAHEVRTRLELPSSGWVTRLDDLLLASYGVVAALLIVLMRREAGRYRAALPGFAAGFALFAAALALDAFSTRVDLSRALFGVVHAGPIRSWAGRLEEMTEVLGGACLWLTFRECRALVPRSAPACGEPEETDAASPARAGG
jgi:hypothetical protein